MKIAITPISPKAAGLFTYLGAPIAAAFVYIALAIAWRQPGDEAYLLAAVPAMLEHVLLSLTIALGGGLLFDIVLKLDSRQ